MSLIKSCSQNSLDMLNSICENYNIKIENNRILNKLSEVNLINKGGFGIVFRAIDNSKPVAIKIVPFYINKFNPKILVSCRINEKLKEVRCLNRLNHINIIKYQKAWIEVGDIIPSLLNKSDSKLEIEDIYDDNEDETRLIYSRPSYNELISTDFREHVLLNISIQMDLFDLSLKKYLQIFGKDDRECIYIKKSILEGVIYLHYNNIIHCDLKPENILIKMNNQNKITSLKIADFGLVITKNCFQTSEIIGTPIYMAPEVKDDIITPAIDVYSLGIIFYEIDNYFETQMERSLEIDKFKKTQHIEVSSFEIYKDMINIDYLKRPSIKHVMKNLKTEFI